MTVASKRPNPLKVKKTTVLTAKVTTTASSGIQHQVILPKSLAVAPSSSSSISSSKIKQAHAHARCGITRTISSPIKQPQPFQAVAVPVASLNVNANAPTSTTSALSSHSTIYSSTKKYGVWYLGGNHVVKLLTSVDGDLDHSILSKLAAVPTVVGELALSVESLVSDDITVGDFENDLLAKIASNTLTAKRGIMAAKAAAVNNNVRGASNVHGAAATSTSSAMPLATVSPTPMVTCTTPIPTSTNNEATSMSMSASTAASSTDSNNNHNANNLTATGPCGSEQVPNPLLANYQPVPNPLAIRITPPASPHVIITSANVNVNVNAEQQQQRLTTSSSTSTSNATSNNANTAETIRTGVPIIHVR